MWERLSRIHVSFPSTHVLFMLLLIPYSFGSTPLFVRFSVGIYVSDLHCCCRCRREAPSLPFPGWHPGTVRGGEVLGGSWRGGDDHRASNLQIVQYIFSNFVDSNTHQNSSSSKTLPKSQKSDPMAPKWSILIHVGFFLEFSFPTSFATC